MENMAVYVESGSIVSALGFSVEEVFTRVWQGQSGLASDVEGTYSAEPVMLSKVDAGRLEETAAEMAPDFAGSRFEKMLLVALQQALQSSAVRLSDPATLLIVSSTKGNIDLLDTSDPASLELNLWHSARLVANHFAAANAPLIISNACISGVAAMVAAQRMLLSGAYRHAVVVGADVLSRFIVSGFQSFKSLSSERCRPFDARRDGLNLGEAAAAMVLSVDKPKGQKEGICLLGGAMHNDANHISGPSRTGEGLLAAIRNAVGQETIDFISAHGTATPYNDNMEAVAISRAGLAHVPVNSLKSFFGHTLGAAGMVETLVSLEAMKRNVVVGTLGYEEHGVSEAINVAAANFEQPLQTVLKLASGFGGSNAAVLFKKESL